MAILAQVCTDCRLSKMSRDCAKHEAEAIPLKDLRIKTSPSVAYAARRLWRRDDRTEADEIILDLLAEALGRLGKKYRPCAKTARQAIQAAPTSIH